MKIKRAGIGKCSLDKVISQIKNLLFKALHTRMQDPHGVMIVITLVMQLSNVAQRLPFHHKSMSHSIFVPHAIQQPLPQASAHVPAKS